MLSGIPKRLTILSFLECSVREFLLYDFQYPKEHPLFILTVCNLLRHIQALLFSVKIYPPESYHTILADPFAYFVSLKGLTRIDFRL